MHVSFHRGIFAATVKRVGLLPVPFCTPLCRFKTDILPNPILTRISPTWKMGEKRRNSSHVVCRLLSITQSNPDLFGALRIFKSLV
jgi:hypothetical protein